MNIDLFVVCCVITVRILIQHFIPYMADYLVKPVSDQLFIKENCGILRNHLKGVTFDKYENNSLDFLQM